MNSCNKNEVPILLVCSNAYAPHLKVVSECLVEYARTYHYDINIFCNVLSAGNRTMLQRDVIDTQGRVNSQGGGSLSVIDAREYAKQCRFLITADLPRKTYDRLFAPDLLKGHEKNSVPRCRHLGKDGCRGAVCRGGSARAMGICLSLKLQNYRASESEILQKKHERRDYFAKVLGLAHPAGKCVNAGVIVMKLRAMREERVQEQLLRAAQTVKTKFCDQCNMICRGHVRHINSAWNDLVSFSIGLLPKKYRAKAISDRRSCEIIHWAASRKSWEMPQVEGADEWWDVARRTLHYGQIIYTNTRTPMRGEAIKMLGTDKN